MNLASLVEEYEFAYQPREERERDAFAKCSSLAQAIQIAALAQTEAGKKHDHQRRIPPAVLSEAARELSKAETAIATATSFAAVYASVRLHIRALPGIGDLAVYDIATRIAAYLGLEPERVYLHRGAADGARVLGIRSKPDRPVAIEVFPRELQRLSPAALENFLCIFKNRLRDVVAGLPSQPTYQKSGSGCGTQPSPSRTLLSRC